MKKTFIIVVSLIIVLGSIFYFLVYPKLEIVSGFNAKILCSCYFITGLDQDRIESEDLGFSLLWLASNHIDEKEKRVYTDVFGMHKKIAVYREGLGCALVNQSNPNDVQNKALNLQSLEYSREIWPQQRIEGNQEIQKALQSAFDSTAEMNLLTRAVLVIKDGELIAEAYADGIDHQSPLLGWSMTKSITSILSGILAKNGKLDIESPLPFPMWEDGRSELTWKQALQMSTGLQWEEEYGDVSSATKMLYSSDDMGESAASWPLEFEPGTHWEYSSGTSNIIARQLHTFFDTKEAYQRYPYEKLFAKVGARSFKIETDASGFFVGSSYGYASARDWGKLGLLMLNEGNWYGEQIIDTSWVDFCREKVADSEGQYGGHFWLNRGRTFDHYSEEAYWMSGYQGQQVAIHPEKNVVIVRLGITNTRGDFDFDGFTRRVLEALES
jgi:CubicO group peptidase (beta-lactamase class C family)